METNNTKTLDLLGLTSPSSIMLDDERVAESYRRFCSQLQMLDSQDVVLADPEFANLYSLKDDDPDAIADINLFSALIGPDKDYLEGISSRILDIYIPQIQQGRYVGLDSNAAFGRAFNSFVNFSQSEDCKRLKPESVPFEVIDHLEGTIASAPGLTWYSALHLIRWTKDWGMLLYYGDSENDQADAFPRIIGFFKMESYPFSGGRLISELPYYLPRGAGVCGHDLLSRCWLRQGEDEGFNIGKHLMELDELSVKALKDHYGSFCNSHFGEDMEKLWFSESEYFDCGGGENLLKGIVDRSGVPGLIRILDRMKRNTITQQKITPQKITPPSCHLRLVKS